MLRDRGSEVVHLLESGSCYAVVSRGGSQPPANEDLAECYDVTTGRPSVPPRRIFRLPLFQMCEGATDRHAVEPMAFDLPGLV